MSDRPIFVTQPHLPPLGEFVENLEEIWASKVLTNGGSFHQQLEKALCERLGVKHICLFTNGTIALLTAVQALDIKGEVITTPYSFVATSHAIAMNGLTPVFVDIDPESTNMDPARIEAAITPRTTAILPVHCYGRPCEVSAIQRIADRHGLRVIYDAAHAFGVEDQGGSILRHGELAVLSFHATKVFNTFEGGAVVCPDLETKQRIDRLKNFGFAGEVTVTEVGTNGKMSEINAAFGMVQLRHLDEALQQRAFLSRRYCDQLANVAGIRVVEVARAQVPNHAYFPILVEPDYPLSRDQLYESLKEVGVFARRYFYPLLSDLPMYRSLPSAHPENLPCARRVAAQVLCLPLYPALSLEDQDRVIERVRRAGASM
jgi:dTDP-4-amino-4,6-dideoxygalactose transaminase